MFVGNNRCCFFQWQLINCKLQICVMYNSINVFFQVFQYLVQRTFVFLGILSVMFQTVMFFLIKLNYFRVFILLLSALSILWIPLVKSSKSGQLFNYIQAVQGYLGTPLGPVFLCAILWKRMTEKVKSEDQLKFWSFYKIIEMLNV